MFDFSHARGFLFDCDGTLLDSLDAWEQAEEMLFAAAGSLTKAQEDEIHAAPIEEAAEILCRRYGAADKPQDILDHLDSFLFPYYRDQAKPLPGAVDFVKTVAKAGIACAVVSSSPQRYLKAGLGRAGMLDYFQALVSTQDTGIAKTEPGIYILACETLGVSPREVWAVDDAPYALEAMASVGIKTIGVGNGCTQKRREEIAAVATIYAETLGDLLGESKF